MIKALDFSVVIPARNLEKTIGKCLESVLNQDYPKGKYEVIVADNCSEDGTADIIKSFPVKYVVSKKEGCGPTRNVAIRNARGKIIASLDGNRFPDKNWLREARKEFRKGQVDMLGGTQLPVEGISSLKKVILDFTFDQKKFVKRGWAGPGNLFVKKEVFSKVGVFDESLWLYSEDTEWGLRATSNGFRLGFSPKLIVYHDPRGFFASVKREFKRGKANTRLREKAKGKKYLRREVSKRRPISFLKSILKKNKNKPAHLALIVPLYFSFAASALAGELFEKLHGNLKEFGKGHENA